MVQLNVAGCVLPWRYDETGELFDANETLICELDGVSDDVGRYMQTACNEHPKLVAALQLARKELVHKMGGDERLIRSSVTIYGIDEALKAVGVNPNG